jgi:GxxExxY protein
MEVHTTPLGRAVIGCAIEVHSVLGPGLLESTYERGTAQEFRICGLSFEEQVAVPVLYKGMNLDCGYRIDFVVEGELVLELKAVERIIPVHQAQMLTYLKLMKLRQGFLINFNVPRLVDGVKSFLL